MKTLAAFTLSFFALSAVAQQSAPVAAPHPAATDSQKIVATVNGELITRAKLDSLYAGIGSQLRVQYERSGGKMAFLDNYVAKRLMIQEALKSGFDKRPEVQQALEAARESALFDRYIRDVITPQTITGADVRKYYDEHMTEFATPEMVKVRHIVITTNGKSKDQALLAIRSAAAEIRRNLPDPRDPRAQTDGEKQILISRFAEAARKYSEDGSAQAGGDLGWQAKGVLDPKFEDAAFHIEPGRVSGAIETSFGFHLILVEEKKPAGTRSFAEVQNDIREFVTAQRAAEVMGSVKRLTNELRASSKVSLYPENVQ